MKELELARFQSLQHTYCSQLEGMFYYTLQLVHALKKWSRLFIPFSPQLKLIFFCGELVMWWFVVLSEDNLKWNKECVNVFNPFDMTSSVSPLQWLRQMGKMAGVCWHLCFFVFLMGRLCTLKSLCILFKHVCLILFLYWYLCTTMRPFVILSYLQLQRYSLVCVCQCVCVCLSLNKIHIWML